MKKKINISYLRRDNDNYYYYFIRQLIERDSAKLKYASIKIDGSGDNEFRKALKNYLNKYIEREKIKKFKFVESHKDNLIQLADMVVGAIARTFNPNRASADKWLNMLKEAGKINDIWKFI